MKSITHIFKKLREPHERENPIPRKAAENQRKRGKAGIVMSLFNTKEDKIGGKKPYIRLVN